MASISVASSVMAPVLPTPAGIWRNSESASAFCTGRMSATVRPVSMVRTPQEMSKPTPPAETTPPCVGIEGRDAADREAVAPVRIGHRVGCPHDPGQRRDIDRLLIDLVVHVADQLFVRVDDGRHAHGAVRLDLARSCHRDG